MDFGATREAVEPDVILYSLPDNAGLVYCGPAAIAAFTGKHPHIEVLATINAMRRVAPQTSVKGMTPSEVKEVLDRMGVVSGEIQLSRWEPLRAFVEKRPAFIGVVSVTGHFVAVAHGLCLDNGSKFAVPVSRFKGNRKMVWNYFGVEF